tara:strand:+ start:2270 stop:2719 length:450 start_codon:yes stop_codon:yes gene_type:complete
MKWIYNKEPIENISQFPENTYGFVYKITHTPSNKSYIGKKILYYQRKVKLGKKELAQYKGIVGRRPAYKLAIKESNWNDYWGSSKPLLEVLKDEPKSNFTKDILILAPTKKLLTYYETQFLFLYRVLEEPEMYFNDNILGKFFRRDFEI